MEVTPIEVRINKEARDYQESLFFGLSLWQFLAVLVAAGPYFGMRNVVGSGEIGWICVLSPPLRPLRLFHLQQHDLPHPDPVTERGREFSKKQAAKRRVVMWGIKTKEQISFG